MSDQKLSDSITVNDACITTFAFETNGFQGGDAGHGGYLDIIIDGNGGTMMNVALDGAPMTPSGSERVIKLRFIGDAEMRNAAAGLEFLATRIRQALCDKQA